MVQSYAVLQVADGVLHLGVSAVVGFQLEGVALSVRDETVIAVVGEERQLGAGRGLHPADDESHWCGVGLTVEGSVNGLGHIGGAVHPVGYGCPVRLWYGLDEIAQSGVLSDGDGEADIHLATDGNDGVGIEAAVGPRRERSRGTGVAHSRHRLPQEVGCAPGGVGSALAQSCHQHVSGSGGNGQQRMIAPLAGVVVLARSLLCQSVGLADRRVYVDRQRRVLGACPGVPGARQQLPAHPVQLSHMSPPETAQEGPQRGWSLDHTTQYRGGPARPQHVDVVYAVAASQSGCHQGQYLVPGVGPPRGVAQVNVVVDELAQTQTPGQGDRQDQPGIGYQAGIVEGDLDAVRVVTW